MNREQLRRRTRRRGLAIAALACVFFIGCVAWWLQSRKIDRQAEVEDRAQADRARRGAPRQELSPHGEHSQRRLGTESAFRSSRATRSDEEPEAGDETAEEAVLQPSQLGLLELPWEVILEALEEESVMAVEMCLEESIASATVAEGLALDFVYKPKRGEAWLSEVRFHAESNARPAGLLDCLEGLLQEGPVPLEIADGLADGIYTLRIGPNRPDAAK